MSAASHSPSVRSEDGSRRSRTQLSAWMQKQQQRQTEKHNLEQKQQHRTSQMDPSRKVLQVTVTVLSVSGVRARERKEKKKLRKKAQSRLFGWRNEADDETSEESEETDPARSLEATIVASFGQENGEGGGSDAHILSLPVPLQSRSSRRGRSRRGRESKSHPRSFEGDVRWPEQRSDSFSKLSSYSFRRCFVAEASSGNTSSTDGNGSSNERHPRYAPQLCPIQISVGCSGAPSSGTSSGGGQKLRRLGSAHLLLSGEEDGTSTTNVPVVDFDRAFKAVSNPIGMGKASMKRVDGTRLECGLADGAALRVLVRVTDPSSATSAEDRETTLSQEIGDDGEDKSWVEGRKKALASPASVFSLEERTRSRRSRGDETSAFASVGGTVRSRGVDASTSDSTGFDDDSSSSDSGSDSDSDSNSVGGTDDDTDVGTYDDTCDETEDCANDPADDNTDGTIRSRDIFSFDTETDLSNASSQGSNELLRLIDDLSKRDRSGNDETYADTYADTLTTSATSMASRHDKRSTSRRREDDHTASTCSTSSISAEGGHRIGAAPRGRGRTMASATPVTPAAIVHRWCQRMTCCAMDGGMVKAGSAGIAGLGSGGRWLLASVDEGDVGGGGDGDWYSLQCRDHSMVDEDEEDMDGLRSASSGESDPP